MKWLLCLAAWAVGCAAGGATPSLSDATLRGDASVDAAAATVDSSVTHMPDGGPGREDDGAVRECSATEACDDGLDGDCDGAIDEGCFCVPGEESACFGGPVASRGVGICRDGAMVCADGLEFGVWSVCEGDVV